MKKFLIIAVIIVAIILILTSSNKAETPNPDITNIEDLDQSETESAPIELPNGDYEVNLTDSTIRWEGAKATGVHFGNITPSDSRLVINEGMIDSGFINIDMSSITVNDLEPGTQNDNLTNHLKSADFFDVENHPESTYTINQVSSIGGNMYKIDGDLTIKDVTMPTSVTAEIGKSNENILISTDLTFNRKDFGVSFDKSNLVEILQEVALKDEVKLNISLAFSPSEDVVDNPEETPEEETEN